MSKYLQWKTVLWNCFGQKFPHRHNVNSETPLARKNILYTSGIPGIHTSTQNFETKTIQTMLNRGTIAASERKRVCCVMCVCVLRYDTRVKKKKAKAQVPPPRPRSNHESRKWNWNWNFQMLSVTHPNKYTTQFLFWYKTFITHLYREVESVEFW